MRWMGYVCAIMEMVVVVGDISNRQIISFCVFFELKIVKDIVHNNTFGLVFVDHEFMIMLCSWISWSLFL